MGVVVLKESRDWLNGTGVLEWVEKGGGKRESELLDKNDHLILKFWKLYENA